MPKYIAEFTNKKEYYAKTVVEAKDIDTAFHLAYREKENLDYTHVGELYMLQNIKLAPGEVKKFSGCYEEWDEQANLLAREQVTIKKCISCGYPVVKDARCNHCGEYDGLEEELNEENKA